MALAKKERSKAIKALRAEVRKIGGKLSVPDAARLIRAVTRAGPRTGLEVAIALGVPAKVVESDCPCCRGGEPLIVFDRVDVRPCYY